MNISKKILVSGTRPTGQLHLGHYFGVLKNWLSLQSNDVYDCYFLIADWHTLTTKYDQTAEYIPNILEVLKDFLAIGIDPNKSNIYLQSLIPETAELHLLFSMLAPFNWLKDDPTLKDLLKGSQDGELNYGMLGYPVLQSADILLWRGDTVPVGKDQVAHLERTRDIARRFNQVYNTDFFPECKPLLTEHASLKGLDGQKMSKSYNNDIKLADSTENITKKTLSMLTDPLRQKRSDAGLVSRCEVPYGYYQILADIDQQNTVKTECETAARGCVDCKRELAGLIDGFLAEIREKRLSISDKEARDILYTGSEAARKVAIANLAEIKSIMKINF